MGWTFTTNRIDIHTARQQHEWDSVRYGDNIRAELIASEWKPHAFFAIIKVTSPTRSETFLRVDLIDTAGGTFGYKDGSEDRKSVV